MKILKDWIKALRSGKYQKCKSVLHRGDDKFCAVGVLLDVYINKYNPDKRVSWREYGNVYELIVKDTHYPTYTIGCAPMSLYPELGVSYSFLDKITALNDFGTQSFKEIADYIEENIEKAGTMA